jgi:hypothetical protein
MTRKLFVVIFGVLGLMQAVDAAAQPRWGRERTPQAGACFYEDRNFEGRYFCVPQGDDLRSIPNGMGDRISSIRLFGGAEVTVFRDRDMRGRSARFLSNERDLRRDGLNDQISSIVVRRRGQSGSYGNNGYGDDRYGNDRDRGRGRGRDEENYGGWQSNGVPAWGRAVQPREGACFYEDAQFRGQYFCVPRGGTYTSLPRGFNDRISSVRIFGAGVRIYQDRDFRGRSREITRDVENLRGDWRDTISSIRVF